MRAERGGAFYGQLAAVDTTRGDGRARVTVRAGTVAGPTYVIVSVPELGLRDSVLFTVAPGAPRAARFTERAVAVAIGAKATLHATLVDAFNNPRRETPPLAVNAPSRVAVFDAASGSVTGVDVGSGYALARYAGATDSIPVRVVPPGRLLAWEASPGLLALVNTDGTGPHVVAPVDGSYINGVQPRLAPAGAPAGASAVALKYQGAVVVDSVGGASHTVLPPPGVTGFTAARLMGDGSVFAVGQVGAPYNVPVGSPLPTALYRITSDGAAAKVIDLPNAVGYPYMADIAPDGSRVAYRTSGPPGLVVVTVATGATAVIDANGVSPRFSAAGDRVAYLASLDVTGGGPLTVANVDGTGRATFGPTGYAPGGLAWSPDGAYVLGRTAAGLRALRLRDGADVVLLLPYLPLAGVAGFAPAGLGEYAQPDWR